MPNWVRNVVKITSLYNFEDIKKFVAGDAGAFDFNCIIPMPDTIYRGDLGEEEKKKYGEDNWYNWSIKNWGTKWNASDACVDEENKTFVFDTAWSAPEKIIEAFARILPDICFVWTWADEDRGSNTGKIICNNGEISGGYTPNNTKEAYENYAYCWGEEEPDEDEV